jgi:hypothetical protein
MNDLKINGFLVEKSNDKIYKDKFITSNTYGLDDLLKNVCENEIGNL